MATIRRKMGHFEGTAVFHGESELKRISFLVTRAQADFEIAVEAVLAGLNSVVLDHMRDVMEI
jgi:hypothetical protein